MSTASASRAAAHPQANAGRLPAGRVAVAVFALVVAAADGFVAVSLRGAVGAIERIQTPFASWLQDTVLTFPFHAAAVVGALALAARLTDRRRAAVRVVAAVLLMTVATSLVGLARLGVSAVRDYRVQSAALAVTHADHDANGTPIALEADPDRAAIVSTCNATCAARRQTVEAHVRGVRIAGTITAAVNLTLLAWMALMYGGRLARSRPAPARATAVAGDVTPVPEPLPA